MQQQMGRFDMHGQWWRVGGALGIAWFVLFLIGGFILQGGTPSRDDSVAAIRQYFTEDGDTYLLGDYLIGIAFVFGFIPYLVVLRWLLGTGEGAPPIWSWLAFVGGVIAVLLAAAASFAWGALALGAAANPEVDDGVVRALMEMNAHGYSGLSLTFALFVAAASVVVWNSGVLWRWLAPLGAVVAVAGVVGAAWVIDGDDEGALAVIAIVSLLGTALWVLLSSINMLMMRRVATELMR